ncbi:MAG: aconitase X catalytic domain-containing protein [Nitrososphaerota archaeon]|nr:aconitase X catalytic domain-containing protein [Nitrososphaerota archaeon]
MHLDSGQEKVLRGEAGEAKQLAMEILTNVGDAMAADSLVPIVSGHVLAHFSSLHEAGIEMLEKFASAGGKFAVPTTVDPASVDLENWRSFGIPEDYAEKQFRLCRAYGKLGGIPCWTCVQYQVCNFPKTGEIVAWSESSSVVFANTLIGCRTNKITSGLDLACALTGLTPRFGMLLDENRRARMSFRVGAGKLSDLDYRSVGFFLGKTSGARVPVLNGLPQNITSDEVKHLGAAAAAAGPITMIHLPGITPGSSTEEDASGGEALERVEIQRSDLDSVEAELDQTTERPDLVAFGVPHLSVSEMGDLAKRLSGRKLIDGVKMYIYTSTQAFDMASRSGIKGGIEASGARLTHTTDAEISPLKRMGFNVVMTNSAKLAELVSSEGEIKIRYAPTEKIIEEVTR